MTKYLLSAILLLSAVAGRSQQSSPALAMQVLHAPQLQPVNGATTVSYEIHLSNFTPGTIQINKLQVLDAQSGAVVYSLEKVAVPQWMYSPDKRADSGRVMAGGIAVLYVDIAFPQHHAPDTLIHRITGLSNNMEFSVTSAKTAVNHRSPVVLGAPLRNGIWAAIYHAAWERGHRRVLFVKGGVPRIPGRYAIDFMQLDNNGKYANGYMDSIKNWMGYGAEVLAVADGVVSSSRTDFTESSTLSTHPAYLADDATGNYISLKIADNTYVFYEHLQPGSIRLTPGQHIKKGAVIARLGFTGQSTGPHLHLHVADRDAPLGAEGIPFVFETFRLTGTYPDFSVFGKSLWQSAGGVQVQNEHPSPNSVINFIIK